MKKNPNLRKNRGPYNKSTGRDYQKENEQYKSKPEQIRKRSERNKARRQMIKAGLVKKGDGKVVDHKDGNTSNNSRKNLRVQSRTASSRQPRMKRKK